MGNWSEKQIVKQEAKEKDKIRKENLAKYFYDLSKLSFAGLVIGVIIHYMEILQMKIIGTQ